MLNWKCSPDVSFLVFFDDVKNLLAFLGFLPNTNSILNIVLNVY